MLPGPSIRGVRPGYPSISVHAARKAYGTFFYVVAGVLNVAFVMAHQGINAQVRPLSFDDGLNLVHAQSVVVLFMFLFGA